MTNKSVKEIVSAKADEMYDRNRPGFIHARRNQLPREGWSRLTFPDGLVCITNSSPIETEHIYNETFVNNDYLDPSIRIGERATIIDVGANVGLFSMYVLTHFKDPMIFAIEPVPETFEALQQNLEGLGAHTVHLYQTAIGDEPDSTIDLVVFQMMTGNSTAYPEIKALQRQALAAVFSPEELEYVYSQRRIRVPCMTLSQIIDQNNINTVDLLKIDTEGAETSVLRGIEHGHWGRIRQTAIEVHDEGRTLPTIRDILSTNGFKVTIHERTRDPFGTVVISAYRPSPN